MFDPTAFDNMKVVIEGALYDFDLDGEIIITDRNDWMNLAKMSRSFDVSFQLPEKMATAKLEMESSLMNLAAELLPESIRQKQSGCQVKLYFFLEEDSIDRDFKEIDRILISIWGETRKFTQIIQYNRLNGPDYRKYTITVEFERLIDEEQMENLVEMIEFMISTLHQLQS